MIDNVPLIQNANDVQQINASIIAMKKASRELDEKIVKLNSLNSELDKKIALLDSGLNKEIEDRKEAINSLDVPSVGGSGKYISAISETDGKISATAGDITSSVSSGNSQPVTSGGVADAISSAMPTYPIAVDKGGTGVNTQLKINKAIIAELTEGTADVTDGTMFVSSNATDNGFAETGDYGPNKPYKRKFITVWNYIKNKISNWMDTVVTTGSSNPITSGAVATTLESYLKCVKAYSVTSSTLDISDLPKGLYLCVFNNMYSSYERFNIGILCNWIMSQNAIKYTTIASDGITVSVNGSIITTNQIRIYGARFYRIGYARGTSDS